MIIDCVKRLDKYLEKNALNKSEIELKKVMSNLTMDVIASCAFGTRIDTYNEKTNEFILNAQKVFRGNWRIVVILLLMTAAPKIIQWTGFSFFEPQVKYFFESAVSLMNINIYLNKVLINNSILRSNRL